MTKNFIGNKKKMEPYKGTLIGPSLDFSAETLQARSEWKDILKVLKDKSYHPRTLYPVKLSFRYKDFPGKQKLKEFINTHLPYKIY